MTTWRVLAACTIVAGLPAFPALANDANVPSKPIPNETTVREKVVVSCTVRADHIVSDCAVVSRVSDDAARQALRAVDGHMHADKKAPGDRVTLTFVYDKTS